MPIDITDVTRRVQYAGSGTGPYNFTFQILDDDDIAVYQDDTLLVKTTDYTVTINVDGTGSITTVSSIPGADNITIIGARPYARLTDFSTGGDFFADDVNDELDSMMILIQQLREENTRSAKLSETTTFSGDLIFPEPSANNLIGWNSAGTALDNKAAADINLTLVSAFVQTLLDDSTAKDFRQTLILDKKGADIASSSTLNLDTATGDLVDVTGTTSITAITLAEGVEKTVRFTGALTLTNGASLVLPGSANITTAAGDFATFRGYASSVVRCVRYSALASGAVGTVGTLTHKGLLDISASGAGQIKFPATQNASSDSNTLDDYEEGTWTPTGNGITFSSASGAYTKTGRVVIASFDILWPVTVSAANARVSSLPFSFGSSAEGGFAIRYTNYSASGLTGFPIPLNPIFDFYNTGGAALTNADLSNKGVRGLMIYFV